MLILKFLLTELKYVLFYSNLYLTNYLILLSEENSMHDFQYVTRAEARHIRDELYQIIREVHSMVNNYFTFQHRPVGSSSRNMITFDRNSNIGFDFDFELEINDDDENYTPDEIRHIMKNAIDRVAPRYGYKHCEDSTSVLTIKKVNTFTCQILHSCDFAIVYYCRDGNKQYIRYNKKNNNYTWEFQRNGFKNLDNKISWLKRNGYWGELRDYYIYKKNYNNNPNKHSRTILVEFVNEMYQKMHY